MMTSEVEIEPLYELLNKTVHATLSHPARVNLGSNFEGYGSVRIDAIDGKLVRLSAGFATFEVECVYPSRGDVQTDAGEVGLQGHLHRCTIVQPIKYLGSVVVE
jgi:hypothetical protein